jgi:hypothetical protein
MIRAGADGWPSDAGAGLKQAGRCALAARDQFAAMKIDRPKPVR